LGIQVQYFADIEMWAEAIAWTGQRSDRTRKQPGDCGQVTETDFKLEIPATAFRRPNRFERFTNSSPRFYQGSLTDVQFTLDMA